MILPLLALQHIKIQVISINKATSTITAISAVMVFKTKTNMAFFHQKT